MEITEEVRDNIAKSIEQAYNLLDEKAVFLGEVMEKSDEVCVSLEKSLDELAQIAKRAERGPSGSAQE